MDPSNIMSDKEFVPFLQSLGVDTYQKSFEWMLNDDQDFAGILRWLYNNLDHNNALSPREEYRYLELEKKDQLLSSEELESAITAIQEQYPGVCLPEDQEAIEDIQLDINMQKEKINMLEKHEEIIKDLINRNEMIKIELNVESTKLKSAYQQCLDDEKALGDECFILAEEVETITEGIVDVVAETLNLYANSHSDGEIAKKFLTFSPLDSYRQSQILFRSHCDLYVTTKFAHKHADNISDKDLLTEALTLEERLTDAICAYVDSYAEICGEQAKLALVTDYSNVHPSQVTAQCMEAQSALRVLDQAENVALQQARVAARHLSMRRSRRAADAAADAALAVRRQIDADLSFLLDKTSQAAALDNILYQALRNELRTLRRLLQFTAQLRQYIIDETDSVRARIESMNKICAEQEICELNSQSSDKLLKALHTILGVNSFNGNNVLSLVKSYNDLQNDISNLNDCIRDCYNTRKDALVAFKSSSKPLMEYVWDGCTKQPNCWDRTVATLSHTLRHAMDRVDSDIMDAIKHFSSVKQGDKQNLRKFWQWFLSDNNRLRAAINAVH